ncbi:hypothetical protein PG984_009949 [Apiospora sp. TS-2023a]
MMVTLASGPALAYNLLRGKSPNTTNPQSEVITATTADKTTKTNENAKATTTTKSTKGTAATKSTKGTTTTKATKATTATAASTATTASKVSADGVSLVIMDNDVVFDSRRPRPETARPIFGQGIIVLWKRVTIL